VNYLGVELTGIVIGYDTGAIDSDLIQYPAIVPCDCYSLHCITFLGPCPLPLWLPCELHTALLLMGVPAQHCTVHYVLVDYLDWYRPVVLPPCALDIVLLPRYIVLHTDTVVYYAVFYCDCWTLYVTEEHYHCTLLLIVWTIWWIVDWYIYFRYFVCYSTFVSCIITFHRLLIAEPPCIWYLNQLLNSDVIVLVIELLLPIPTHWWRLLFWRYNCSVVCRLAWYYRCWTCQNVTVSMIRYFMHFPSISDWLLLLH